MDANTTAALVKTTANTHRQKKQNKTCVLTFTVGKDFGPCGVEKSFFTHRPQRTFQSLLKLTFVYQHCTKAIILNAVWAQEHLGTR